jgi:hypothetical protein
MDYILLFFAVLSVGNLIVVLVIFNTRMWQLTKARKEYFKSLKKYLQTLKNIENELNK